MPWHICWHAHFDDLDAMSKAISIYKQAISIKPATTVNHFLRDLDFANIYRAWPSSFSYWSVLIILFLLLICLNIYYDYYWLYYYYIWLLTKWLAGLFLPPLCAEGVHVRVCVSFTDVLNILLLTDWVTYWSLCAISVCCEGVHCWSVCFFHWSVLK